MLTSTKVLTSPVFGVLQTYPSSGMRPDFIFCIDRDDAQAEFNRRAGGIPDYAQNMAISAVVLASNILSKEDCQLLSDALRELSFSSANSDDPIYSQDAIIAMANKINGGAH